MKEWPWCIFDLARGCGKLLREGFPAEDMFPHKCLKSSLPLLQITCSPRERPTHRPTPELKIKTKSYRRESILHSSPSAAPKRTPEPPGSVESQGVFPCRECERY